MASQIITFKSPTTGLLFFQKFVHDTPPPQKKKSFVIMAYYEGNPSAERDSPHKGPVMWNVFPAMTSNDYIQAARVYVK